MDQTHKNLEIILIDDGSNDKCPEMCDKWEKKDNRIQVIHQKNSGVSSARNIGIEISNGDWIAFLDSDDWIEPDYFESLLGQMNETGKCDIFVVSGYIKELVDSSTVKHGMPKIMLYQEKDEIELMAARTLVPQKLQIYYPVICTPWNKLYNAEFLKRTQLKFDLNMKVWEDAWFNFNLFFQCERIGEGSYIGYHYRVVEDSISHGFDLNRPTKDKCYREKLYKFLTEQEKISELLRQTIYQAIITSASEDLRLCYVNPENNMTKSELHKAVNDLKNEPSVYEAINEKNNKGYDIKRLAVKFILRQPYILPIKIVYRIFMLFK